MSRELKFICAQPDDNYYVWQVHLWLENLRNLGHSDKAIVLIFTPLNREQQFERWKKVTDLYPEVEFNFYKDRQEDNVTSLLGIYIPILRPYMLWRYFKDHPERSADAIFYYDSDVLLTERFNIDAHLEDDINYISDARSYINASYFDSKTRDVKPDKLEEYKSRDILAEVTSLIGITREICEEHNEHSGGAQYLLKNMDAAFWSKMMNDTILIRTYLQKINREFFESESKGFQSWCADMWALLWNLWLREVEVKVIPEMDFAWAPDPISKLDTHTIYHNAGIVGEIQDNYPCFYKGKYHTGTDPFKDTQIDIVLNHEESKKHCIWFYAKALKELHEKYHLDY